MQWGIFVIMLVLTKISFANEHIFAPNKQKLQSTPPIGKFISEIWDFSGDHGLLYGYYTTEDNKIGPLIYTSKDEGTTWHRASFNGLNLSSINILNYINCFPEWENSYCIGVGKTGEPNQFIPLTYISKDRGNTWDLSRIQPSPVDNLDELFNFACDKQIQNCVTAGLHNSSPLTYISPDGGNTWYISETLPPPVADKLSKFTVSCDEPILVCKGTGIGAENKQYDYISYDGGQNWTLSL